MAWVPLEESNVGYSFISDRAYISDSRVTLTEEVASYNGSWEMYFSTPVRVRITAEEYRAGMGSSGLQYHRSVIDITGESIYNEAHPWPLSNFPDNAGVQQFSPYMYETVNTTEFLWYFPTCKTSDYMPADMSFSFLIEVWEEEPGPTPPSGGGGYKVYELDRGWSFDGNYIPHFLELNWYFGDDPIHYHTVQKVRVHGTSKGLAGLTLAVNGMQTDYEEDYSEPQVIDLPRQPKHISTELLPMTNYTDTANRGLSVQMKFEGRNIDLSKPEPQHVLQVLSLQSSPAGTGFRSN